MGESAEAVALLGQCLVFACLCLCLVFVFVWDLVGVLR